MTLLSPEAEVAERPDMDYLRRRFQSEPEPKCRICGAEMHIGAIGGGRPTIWYCSAVRYIGGSKEEQKHFSASRYEQTRHGDGEVRAAVAYIEHLEAENARQARELEDAQNQIMDFQTRGEYEVGHEHGMLAAAQLCQRRHGSSCALTPSDDRPKCQECGVPGSLLCDFCPILTAPSDDRPKR